MVYHRGYWVMTCLYGLLRTEYGVLLRMSEAQGFRWSVLLVGRSNLAPTSWSAARPPARTPLFRILCATLTFSPAGQKATIFRASPRKRTTKCLGAPQPILVVSTIMSDPLSLAASAAGLVSLGLQVCGGITQYLDALDCREQDISSARQQNESLQKLFPIIESSLSQLRGDHHEATAAAQDCLNACKTNLKALEDLLADLTGSCQAHGEKRIKVTSRGKKLFYPFKRSKLRELEEKLSRTNAALQLPLQALELWGNFN